MKILFWVPYPTEGASNRYRVEQYLPYLKKADIEYVLHSFWTVSAFRILYKPGYRLAKFYYFFLGTILRLLDLITIFRYDAVFIHRESYPIGGAFFESILAMLGKPFIFDFDDAIFLPDTSRPNNFIEKYKNPKKVGNIIKMSKKVIVGNRYLADFALNYNNSVSIIPTPIDTERYFPHQNENSRGITIGWMGSVTTSGFLEMMKDVFNRLSGCFPDIRFKIVGGELSFEGLSNIIVKPWSLEEELEDLASFDIGIMPIPDNAWTKGKCGFKAILYMSMGIPCVCSPVGINKEIINDGVNGFLADAEEEWFRKLSLLIEDSQLRKKLGLEGRKTVKERYSLDANVPRYLGVLQKAANDR